MPDKPKIAVVLFNLGGPDGKDSVKPFLYNLFSDPLIIRLPFPLRQFVAWAIATSRNDKAVEIYALIGGGSPIVKNTQEQAKGLEQALAPSANTKCFIAMRYWHPFSREAIAEINDFRPDKVILLPLYPQFSTTTTQSSLSDFYKSVKEVGGYIGQRNDLVSEIRQYPDLPEFIDLLAERLADAYEKASVYGKPAILLSTHGLPKKIAESGDPYTSQCETTANSIREKAGKLCGCEASDFVLCYQSRVGPVKWTTPYADAEIIKAAKNKRPVIMVPIAFVSEHSETLVEMDMEYKQLAMENGAPFFYRVATAGADSGFIAGLARMVEKFIR